MKLSKVNVLANDIRDNAQMYLDGMITSHELGSMLAGKVLALRSEPDQGCDDRPPNNILPSGERDDGIVFVG